MLESIKGQTELPIAIVAAQRYDHGMARIRSLIAVKSNVSVHPTEVDATFQTVFGSEGVTFFQLSTYGSDGRAREPKVSQTIQVDVDMAKVLVAELTKAFGPQVLP